MCISGSSSTINILGFIDGQATPNYTAIGRPGAGTLFARAPLFNVKDEDSVSEAGGIARFGHLKGDEFSVIANDGIRGFISGIVAEIGQPFVGSAAIELQFPKINVVRTLVILLIALDKCVLSIWKNAFGLVVLAGRVGIVGHLLRYEINSSYIGALITVRAEGEFALVRRAEVLGLHGALEGQIFAVNDELLMCQRRLPIFIDDIRLLHPRASGRHLIGILRSDVRPGDVHPRPGNRRSFRTFAG